MRRTHTAAVIALVAHVHPPRDRPSRQLPSDAVCPAHPTSDVKRPITSRESPSGPLPTRFGFAYLAPETLAHRNIHCFLKPCEPAAQLDPRHVSKICVLLMQQLLPFHLHDQPVQAGESEQHVVEVERSLPDFGVADMHPVVVRIGLPLGAQVDGFRERQPQMRRRVVDVGVDQAQVRRQASGEGSRYRCGAATDASYRAAAALSSSNKPTRVTECVDRACRGYFGSRVRGRHASHWSISSSKKPMLVPESFIGIGNRPARMSRQIEVLDLHVRMETSRSLTTRRSAGEGAAAASEPSPCF